MRKLWLAGSLLLLVILSWFAVTVRSVLLSHGALNSTQLLVGSVLLSALAFGAGLSGFAFWKSGPGAVGLSVDSAGVRFRWKSGKEDQLRWDQVKRGLTLLDYTGNPLLSNRTKNLWEARRWNRPASFLSREAFHAIIEGATGQGFAVETMILKNPGWGWAPCTRIRIVDSLNR